MILQVFFVYAFGLITAIAFLLRFMVMMKNMERGQRNGKNHQQYRSEDAVDMLYFLSQFQAKLQFSGDCSDRSGFLPLCLCLLLQKNDANKP